MSLSEAHSKAASSACPVRGGRLALAVAGLLIGTPLIGACGFQPLYGPTASGKQLTEVLAGVEISPIPGRVGQRVRNDLIFYKTGGGRATTSGDYRLDIAVREYTQTIFVSTAGLGAGQVYSLDATFKLVRLKDSKVILTGNAYARAPYEVNKTADPSSTDGTSTGRSVFANVRAGYDAQNRAATSIAGDIKTRVAAFLSGAA